jgi:cell pole-organizing protein PopZ
MSDGKSTTEPSMDEILASIRRILAEDERTVTAPPVRARAPGDVLELTEALNDDGSVRHIPPIALVPPKPAAPILPDGRIEPVPPRPQGASDPRPLVSDTASEAIAASFARLAAVPGYDGGSPAVEDLVRETLRPLLQAWLDENLPALVERLVRAEIARVVGDRPVAP